MREFFDAVDAGGYDKPALIVAVLLFAGLWIWQRLLDRRAERRLLQMQARTAFYDGLHRAQRAFEEFGPKDPRTQEEVVGALVCWQRWTDKPVPSGDRQDLSPIEEDAAQLMRVLETGDRPAM